MTIKSFNKVISFFILFSACLYVNAQGSWELIETPTGQHLRSVYFTDSLYGWAVGDTGTIIHTQDGGDSWVEQDAGTDNNVVHVFFLDRQSGWASSWNFEGFYGTLVLKTTDGGNTWIPEAYPEDNIFMNCILYLDSLRGWMGGSPHAIVSTNDGGQNWMQSEIDTNALAFFPVMNIYFYDDNYGYACGGMFDIAGVTWSTSDGGEKWYPIDNTDAPADEVHGLHMFDSVNVLGAGGDPDLGYGVGMLRTANGGMHWDYEELTMAGNAFDLDFRNDSEAWAPLGPSQQMIYSLDAGTSWTLIPAPESTAIFDMIFTDTLHGYAVGYDGAAIRYVPKPVGVGENESRDMIGFHIFPNPSHGVVNILLEQEIGEERSLVVYNLNGKILFSQKISDLSTSIDLKGIPAGVYICEVQVLRANKECRTQQKLILR